MNPCHHQLLSPQNSVAFLYINSTDRFVHVVVAQFCLWCMIVELLLIDIGDIAVAFFHNNVELNQKNENKNSYKVVIKYDFAAIFLLHSYYTRKLIF